MGYRMLWPDDGTWPPADLTVAMPTEPRPPCWTKGPCGDYTRLPPWIQAIAVASGGPAPAAYYPWDRGQLMMADILSTDPGKMFYLGYPRGVLDADFVDFELLDDGVSWRVTVDCPPGLLVPVEFHGEQILTPDMRCPRLLDVPVTTTMGPAPQPTNILISMLAWYQTPTYLNYA